MRIRRNVKFVALVGILLCTCVLYLMVAHIYLPNNEENQWIHISTTQTFETKIEENTTGEVLIPRNRTLSCKELVLQGYKYPFELNFSGTQKIKQIFVPQNQMLTCEDRACQSYPYPFELNISCNTSFSQEPMTSVQMLSLYKQLKFDNPDGGSWKQGWDIQYSPDQWNCDNKLKVFVIPHSHNDPGWLMTFENYYIAHTRKIFLNMIKELSGDRRKKFIWAEISFLSLFWDEVDDVMKEAFKKLLTNGQLEIVTGGWVMNDEANTNYFAILQQLIEGHQWVKHHLNYTPVNSWAIDPFGHTPTMPYLLKRMGFQNLVIQRVHYSVKKSLARSRNLEFFWRQMWDGSKSTDLFTQLMPFYSYDIPHSCGPDPKICCQFDFKRFPMFGEHCPWNVLPEEITKENVKLRAEMLLDQYRKKAQLFRTNVLLVPLGDDFRFDRETEWIYQFSNYQKLFDYMNSNPLLFVEARFGTLKDYFSTLHESHPPDTFGVLSGDFFTYADVDDHFWSGYFTSRPFYKRLDRVLINYLRCAELLYGLAWGREEMDVASRKTLFSDSGLKTLIVNARRSLSLFQHHDGITGTARDLVVVDYAIKMHEAIKGLRFVMQLSAHFLLSHHQQSYFPSNNKTVYLNVDEVRTLFFSLPLKFVIEILENNTTFRAVIFNSLTWKRHEVVTLCVNFPYVRVTNSDGNNVMSQTSPIFLETGGMNLMYHVSFVAEIEPLSLETYFISRSNENFSYNVLSAIKVYNFVGVFPECTGFENIETIEYGREFSISNRVLEAHFNQGGFLKALSVQGKMFPVNIDFAIYRPRRSKVSSGAYLFVPKGHAVSISSDVGAVVRVIEGPIFSEVNVVLDTVQHTVKLYQTVGADSLGLEISNFVDISTQEDYELAMRVTSKLKNGDEFFTDLNGLQMIKRKRFNKLPIQGNFFPMSSAAYLEDKYTRLTIVSGQPVGLGSLKEGQMEVMHDRRFSHDDHRGLGQPVLDNIPIVSVFRLILERRQADCMSMHKKHPSGLLSRYGNLASLSLLYPLMRLFPKRQEIYADRFTPVTEELGHDIHLVKLHNMWTTGAGIILHRMAFDKCLPAAVVEYRSSNGEVNISSLFPRHFGDSVISTSLSFLHWGTTTPKSHVHQICTMEMKAYIITDGDAST